MPQARRLVASLTLAIAVTSLLACSRDPNRVKKEYLASGNAYFDQKKYAEAIIQYRNALQQDPLYGDAHLKLGESYQRLSDIPNAAREYVRAADAMPDNVDVQIKAASFLLLVGRFEESRARAQKVLKLSPRDVQAQVILGDSLVGMKDFPGALKEFEEAVTLDPSSTSALQSLAVTQVALGRQKEAEEAYRKAVDLAPNSPNSHLALASFLWISGRFPEAERSLAQVLRLAPQNATAHRGLATLFLATHRDAEAESHLKALADADKSPGSLDKLGLADYYIAKNRTEDALPVLQRLATGPGTARSAADTRIAAIRYVKDGPAAGNRAIDTLLEREPHNPQALLVKARFKLAEGRYDEALKFANSSAQADPQSVPARYLIGTIYRAQRQPDKAIAAFSEVLRINPRANAAQAQLAELNLAKGKNEAALQLASEAAKRGPGDQQLQLTLLHTLLVNRQLDRATTLVRELVTKYPQSSAMQGAAATVAMARGERDLARTAFAKAYELDSRNTDALEGLVRLDLAEHNPTAAKTRVEQELARHPRSPVVILLSARVAGASGDPKKAEERLRQLVQLDPSNLAGYALLGELYASQHRIPEAKAAFQSILKVQPESVPVNTILGTLYAREGNRAEARRQYERVLQIDPHAIAAANNLAFIYAEDGGNLDVALQLAQTAKQKLPSSPEVADTVGWVYVKKSLPSLAVPQLQQAADGAPANAMIQYHLGVALTKAGKAALGREALQKALSLNLDAATATEARKLLEGRES